jgi:hypothetical protein
LKSWGKITKLKNGGKNTIGLGDSGRNTIAPFSFILPSVSVSPWMHKALNKITTAFLWTGTDMVQRDKCLVARKRIHQRPLHIGGLGVLDLNLFGTTLRARWLWLQRLESAQPWTSMNIIEDKQTTAFFNASVCFTLGNGETFLF